MIHRQLESSKEDTLITHLPSINILDSVPEGHPFKPIQVPNFATSARRAFTELKGFTARAFGALTPRRASTSPIVLGGSTT